MKLMVATHSGSQERMESIKRWCAGFTKQCDFDSFADKLGLPESSKNKDM